MHLLYRDGSGIHNPGKHIAGLLRDVAFRIEGRFGSYTLG